MVRMLEETIEWKSNASMISFENVVNKMISQSDEEARGGRDEINDWSS